MPLPRLSLTGRMRHLKPPPSLHFERIEEWKDWSESREKAQGQWVYQRPVPPGKEKCWKTGLDGLEIIRMAERLILVFWMTGWKERGFITLVTQALLQLKSYLQVKNRLLVSTLCGYCLRGFIKGKPPRRTVLHGKKIKLMKSVFRYTQLRNWLRDVLQYWTDWNERPIAYRIKCEGIIDW